MTDKPEQKPIDVSSILKLRDAAKARPTVHKFSEWELIRDPQARERLYDLVSRTFENLDKQPPGNPYNAPDTELREAAQRVEDSKVSWRGQHNKKAVPTDVTSGFIDDAIKWIADKRSAVIAKGSGAHVVLEKRIRTALKGRHF